MGTHKQGPVAAGPGRAPTRSAQAGRTCGWVGETCASPGREKTNEWGLGRTTLASDGDSGPRRKQVNAYARKGAAGCKGTVKSTGYAGQGQRGDGRVGTETRALNYPRNEEPRRRERQIGYRASTGWVSETKVCKATFEGQDSGVWFETKT